MAWQSGPAKIGKHIILFDDPFQIGFGGVLANGTPLAWKKLLTSFKRGSYKLQGNTIKVIKANWVATQGIHWKDREISLNCFGRNTRESFSSRWPPKKERLTKWTPAVRLVICCRYGFTWLWRRRPLHCLIRFGYWRFQPIPRIWVNVFNPK